MGAFIVYMLKAACCLAVFYLFFKVLLSRDTFFRFNRITLLVILAISFVLPGIEISVKQVENGKIQNFSVESMILLMQYGSHSVTTVPAKVVETGLAGALIYLYLAGVIFFLIRFVISMWQIYKLIDGSKQLGTENSIHLVVHHNKQLAPFSWMNYIVLSDYDLHSEYREGILAHERAHIIKRHSFDILFVELCAIVQWFNPAVWLTKIELQNVHEFEADESVLDSGINEKQYQLLLIKKAVGSRLYSIANSINHSSIKKRITMMIKKKSNPWACVKYFYVLPLAAVAVAAFARPEISRISEKVEEISKDKVTAFVPSDKAVPAKELEKPSVGTEAAVETSDSVYVMADEMPKYPGGNKALLAYLQSNLKCPAELSGKSTRVIVQFVVQKDGSISGTWVVRSGGAAADAEALRVVNSMPKWVPGRQKGKSVDCKYTLPVTFGSKQHATAGATSSNASKLFDGLVVIDGKKVTSEELNKLAPSRIASMTVIKKEQAVKMYGEDGKNGAIEIVTKQEK